MAIDIPIILFAYARPHHVSKTLDCLRMNQVPLIYAFSDGPRTPDKKTAVDEVRRILHSIDWCNIVISEREANLGLGRSILAGVTEVLNRHNAAIIFEDDLVCVPGTYDYLCAAMKHYQGNSPVMSVTGWTHPTVTPGNITDQPYFDGRAESLCWGTWASAWKPMKSNAETLMKRCKSQGIDIYRYGADLVDYARSELLQNTWAVRFLYWQILNKGLCLRPPWSMVEHIGFDKDATNAYTSGQWASTPLKQCPPLPKEWPAPVENSQCPSLWQEACGTKPVWTRRAYKSIRYTILRMKNRMKEKSWRK